MPNHLELVRHNEVSLAPCTDEEMAVAQACARRCPVCNSPDEYQRHLAMARDVLRVLAVRSAGVVSGLQHENEATDGAT